MKMSLKEQVAYLKGLAEGFDLSTESKEGKLLTAIVDTLSIMADEIDDLIENALDIGDELDAISDDLADVEEFVFEDDDDDDLFFDYDDDDDDNFDFDDDEPFFRDVGNKEDDEDDSKSSCDLCGVTDDTGDIGDTVDIYDTDDTDDITYDVECPACGTEIELTEADLAEDSIICPKCNQFLEFEFEDDGVDNEGTAE